MKLQKKISIIILGVTAAFLTSGFSLSYYLSLRHIRDEIYNHLETAVQSRKHHIETFIEMMKGRMVDFSSDGYIRDCLSDLGANGGGGCTVEDLTKHLARNKLPAIKELTEVFVLDARGNVLASTEKRHAGQNKSREPYFTQGSKRSFMGDVYFSEILKEPAMVVSAPLTEGNNLMGVVAGRLRPQWLNNIVSQRDGMGKTGEVYIVNSGRYMITPSRFKEDVVLKQEVKTPNAQTCFAQVEEVMKNPRGMNRAEGGPVLAKDYRGVPVLGTHAYLPEMGWCLLAGIDEKEVTIPLYDLLLAFIALGAVLLFLAYLVSGWLANKISRPITNLERWTRRISGGDWERPVPVNSKDEIGQLSQSFNGMIIQLRDAFGSLREEKEKLAESEAKIRAVIENASDGIVVTDEELRVKMVNPAYERMLGYAADELMGKDVLMTVPPVDRDKYHSDMEEYFKLGKTNVAGTAREFLLRRKNGGIFDAEISVSAIRTVSGRMFVAIVRDISERKRVEERVQKHLQRFQKLSEVGLLISGDSKEVFQAIARTALDLVPARLACITEIVKEDLHVLCVAENGGGEVLGDIQKYPLIFAPCSQVHKTKDIVFCDNAVSQYPKLTFLKEQGVPFYCGIPAFNKAGEVIGVLCFLNDKRLSLSGEDKDTLRILAQRVGIEIERKQYSEEQRLNQEELRKLSLAIEQSPTSVLIINAKGVIEYVNPKFSEVTGYAPQEVIGKDAQFLKSTHMPEGEYEKIWWMVNSGREWRGEIYNRKKSGELFWEKVAIFPIKTADGRITHFIEEKEDISRQKEYEERLLHQANFDGLTELPNRILTLDRLQQALENAKRRRENIAVLFVDLDNFTAINDTLGHDKGEKVLVETAKRLKSFVRKTDTVGRFGDDEFLIVLTGTAIKTSAEGIAQKILESFSAPFMLDDRETFASVSIGISIFPDDTNEPSTLVRNADMASRHVKEAGGKNLRFFEPVMNEQLTRRMHVRQALHHSLERSELSLVYQPIIEASSEKIIGAEALLRWKNPELGAISPESFIPLAEETGLIIPIAEWILNVSCQQAQHWRVSGGAVCMLRLAVNISSRNLKAGNLVETVKSALGKSKLPPECLELEITERMLMDRSPEAISILSRLKDLGIRLSIDDFGTGYSALSYLREFPFDTLKIDRSFIKDITTDDKGFSVVKAIIRMSQSMGIKVIGEGVETREQLEMLRSFGCDFIQGYYFSKPLTEDKLQEFMRARTVRQ